MSRLVCKGKRIYLACKEYYDEYRGFTYYLSVF
jgi:hypothetical protein